MNELETSESTTDRIGSWKGRVGPRQAASPSGAGPTRGLQSPSITRLARHWQRLVYSARPSRAWGVRTAQSGSTLTSYACRFPSRSLPRGLRRVVLHAAFCGQARTCERTAEQLRFPQLLLGGEGRSWPCLVVGWKKFHPILTTNLE